MAVCMALVVGHRVYVIDPVCHDMRAKAKMTGLSGHYRSHDGSACIKTALRTTHAPAFLLIISLSQKGD